MRHSYRKLMELPAWGLYGQDGLLVAAVRAADAQEARELFRRAHYHGARVRRLPA